MKKADNSERNKNYQSEVEMGSRGKNEDRNNVEAEKKGEGEEIKQEQMLLERIVSKQNLNEAYIKVKRNGGSAGIDKLEIKDLLSYLQIHGEQIRKQLLSGEYEPKPVKRVEIRKPDGGTRMLGIPTVVDRMIQQAIGQVISPIFEKEFSDYSYGFRPGKSAHDAVKQSQKYIQEGNEYVVDIDLEKFFDRVNHDKLMYLISRKIEDKRILRLIRKYLESGVMINGVVNVTEEGTPQGGPLSPLLSNIMLNELDKELEKRGHKFCRYADDCNIHVKSLKAGERVMKSISEFIEKKLKLKVNREKSAVDKPSKRKFLGFSFYKNKGIVKLKLHTKSIHKIKEKIKRHTSRSKNKGVENVITNLRSIIIGWVNYYKLADMKKFCNELDAWMRRRIRMIYWKQWKKIKTKHDNLVKLGVDFQKAWEHANTRKSYWHTANSYILSCSLTNEYLAKQGLISFLTEYAKRL